MNREQLIEKARVAFVEAWHKEDDRIERWDRDDRGKGNRSRAGIRAALAVFEEAYANDLATSSERVKNRPDSSHVIPTECLDCGRTDGGCDRIIVTPTDDERETLHRDVTTPRDDEWHRLWEGLVQFAESYRREHGYSPNESARADYLTGAGFHRTVQGDSKDLRVAESPVQGEPSSLAVQPAIDAVRMVLLGMAERMDEFAYEEISSALDDIPDCENWTTVPHAEHVQGEPTRDSEEHLRGRWSNGDPVHIITDGSNRHVAPNLNGATWIPGAVEPYDRYAEHDRAKREGGYCRGCDEKFPAPQGEPSDALIEEALVWVGRAWDDGNASGLDGWVGPGRGSGEIDREAQHARTRLVHKSEAALRAAAATGGEA